MSSGIGYGQQIVQAGHALGYGTERDPRRRYQVPLPPVSGSVADVPAAPTTSRPITSPTPEARIEARDPSLRERVTSWLSGDDRPSPERARMAEGLTSLSDFSPAGMLYGLQEMYRADPGTANMAMGALGAVPGGRGVKSMADELGQVGRKYIPPTAAAAPLADNRIAQRVPSSKQAVENGLEQDLRINVDTMRQTPETMDKAGMLLNDILPRSMAGAPTDEKFGAAQALMVDNLKHLYNTAPQELIQRAPLWYPGSNRIVTDLGQELGIPTTSAAGMAAALSPQKDWFQNVSLAQRIGRSLAEDPRVDQRMLDRLASGSEGMASHTPQLARHLGRRISELEPADAGRAVWAHDIAYRDPSFRAWNPEGEDLGYVLKNSGENDTVTHQGLDATAKAVSSYRSGGDTQIISPLMGEAHKVRNFYNDIIAPYAKYDDWTNDTHNIAGSLYRPLSAGDTTTKEGLGNMGPKSAHTGAKGLYGLYADAGRQAAREVGMDDVSGMQSLVWEQIRSRMPKAFKGQASNKRAVDAIWDQYRNGSIGADEARSQIDQFIESKSPIKPPGWMR